MMCRLNYIFNLFALFASTCTVGLPLYASTEIEQQTPQIEGERVALGERKPPHELLEKKGLNKPQKNKKKARSNKNSSSHHGQKKHSSKKSVGVQVKGNFYTPSYLIKSVGASGKTLVTSDETVWGIDQRYAQIVSRWPVNSYVVIKPNRFHIFDYKTWLTTHDYWLYNITTGERALADLENGPLLKNATLITSIVDNYILLSDGSLWEITSSYSAYEKLRYWKLQQAVLIGEDDCMFYNNNYILINLNENNYISVRCIQLPNYYTTF